MLCAKIARLYPFSSVGQRMSSLFPDCLPTSPCWGVFATENFESHCCRGGDFMYSTVSGQPFFNYQDESLNHSHATAGKQGLWSTFGLRRHPGSFAWANMDQLAVQDAQMHKMFLLRLVFEFATCFHPVCATIEHAKRFWEMVLSCPPVGILRHVAVKFTATPRRHSGISLAQQGSENGWMNFWT